MKRTLFNTMMGCLAALSLAGCGGSGSSSSGPSESLISEGFGGVGIHNPSSQSSSEYSLVLYSSDQKFELILPKEGDDTGNYHEVTGTWSAKSLGNGKFELSLTNLTSGGSNCKIDGDRSVDLTILNMEEYRAGELTAATLSGAPFTHDGTCGYSLNTDQGGTAAIKQLDSLGQ